MKRIIVCLLILITFCLLLFFGIKGGSGSGRPFGVLKVRDFNYNDPNTSKRLQEELSKRQEIIEIPKIKADTSRFNLLDLSFDEIQKIDINEDTDELVIEEKEDLNQLVD